MRQALAGIKVADFSWMIAGPMAAEYLALFGAEVVRVETSVKPDDVRTFGPFKDDRPGVNRGGFFANINTGKYGMTLNLNSPRGREVALRLIRWADVVQENFTPGTMARWGLGYEEARRANPGVIYLSTSAQGQTGPHARHPAVGFTLQAAVGFSHLTGWPDREPTAFFLPYTNYVVPWFMLLAVLSALDHRRRTGQGQYIDLSQLEASLHFLSPALLDFAANRREGDRVGNASSRAAPHGVYPCKGEDAWCAIAVCDDRQWQGLCRALGEPPWTREPHFSTFLGRLRHSAELDSRLAEWTRRHTPHEAMALLQAHGVPAGAVLTNREVAGDPHLRARGHFVEVPHPEMGRYLLQMPAFHLSKTPPAVARPAPCVGEHTEHVFTRLLGGSDQEFLALLEAGAFE